MRRRLAGCARVALISLGFWGFAVGKGMPAAVFDRNEDDWMRRSMSSRLMARTKIFVGVLAWIG